MSNRIKAALIRRDLDFPLFTGVGAWDGKEERSLAVELDHVTRPSARKIAKIIKAMNQQEAVLLQEIPVKSELV